MNTVFFENPLMRIGSFAMQINDPEFCQMGNIINPHIVFPKNSIWIKHEGREAFVADTSLVNLYNSQQTYKRFAINPLGDFCHWIELYPELLQQSLKVKNNFVFSQENIQCDLNLYLQHLYLLNSISDTDVINELEIEEIVLEMLNDIMRVDSYKHVKQESNKQQNKLIERIKKNINLNLSVNMNLTDIAKLSFSSPFHISRIFKQKKGIGINQYRNQQRLRLISHRLQQGCDDLASLALNFGYSSHSHLSCCFKKYYGFTPSEYRQRCN